MTVKPARVPCSSWAPALDAGHRAGALGSDHVDAEEVAEALAGAFEVGYRHFDCAAVYGNEENIGRVLEGLPREQMWAISKLWNNKHAEEDAALACRKSLADLRLDYLEMYLVHWPLRNFHARGVDVSSRSPDARPYVHEEFMATWGRMESLVDMRLTRHIGTSNMTVPKLALLLRDARIALSVNEMELHPHLQQPELISYVRSHGIEPVGFSPVGSPLAPLATGRPRIRSTSRTPYWSPLRNATKCTRPSLA